MNFKVLMELIEIRDYSFDKSLPVLLSDNKWANELWPAVYILKNDSQASVYVGETTDLISRMSQHLSNASKQKLDQAHMITCGRFNKSATLDIEANLIKYLHGDGKYKLLNGNLGLANHSYYDKGPVYWPMFKRIWEELRRKKIVNKKLTEIDNSDLFKYSPYKSLGKDQLDSLKEVLKGFLVKNKKTVMVQGGAGTGKSILAIFLFKLLYTDLNEINFKQFESEEKEFISLLRKVKKRHPHPEIGLVVPMAAFRKTLKKVFKNIKGLNPSMVIGPAEVVTKKFDILIVDEAHRLRRRVNLGTYFKAFDVVSKKLKLDVFEKNELDWVQKCSKHQVLFYDPKQSIKPSDVEKKDFDLLRRNAMVLSLKSQFRVKGGADYISFVDELMENRLNTNKVFEPKNYELLLFDNLSEMQAQLLEKEKENGLARLVAGYSWEWISRKKKTHDIQIGDVKLRWNSVALDWINSREAVSEVGCIHTTQGYDLNYTGVIFGNEITFDTLKDRLICIRENYYDRNGRNGIKNDEDLLAFIVNIYKTLMLRGIRGTYVYACDERLRDYFKKHIPLFVRSPFRIIPLESAKPYENCVPLYDVTAAAGGFSEPRDNPNMKWIELPPTHKHKPGYFVIRVEGNSMNKKIPNGSWCLFKQYEAGSRNGEIILAQHHNIRDPEFGYGYTVKYYSSEKSAQPDTWTHTAVTLKPSSTDPFYEAINLDSEEAVEMKIIGIFVAVL